MATDQFEAAEPFVKVKRDRHGRYLLPEPKDPSGKEIPWTRVTTLARTLSDEYMLNQWRIRQVVYGIGQRPDLAALAHATNPDDKGQLQEIGERAQEVAGASAGASLGRALHTFTQRLDGGRPSAPPQYLPFLQAYQGALQAVGYAPRPHLMERIVVCPEIPAAGQFDRILLPAQHLGREPVGTRPVIGDLKTAKLDSIQFAWLEIAIQLSVYAHATMMWDHDQERYHAMPDVDLGKALVMHLPQDLPADRARCDIYEIDIVKGWECALLAKQVRAARSAQKSLSRFLQPTALATKVEEIRPDLECVEAIGEDGQEYMEYMASVTPLARVLAATSRRELAALWQEGTSNGWWTPELTAVGERRLAEMREG